MPSGVAIGIALGDLSEQPAWVAHCKLRWANGLTSGTALMLSKLGSEMLNLQNRFKVSANVDGAAESFLPWLGPVFC